ncbi:hypothetical protein BB561_006213 [Smittium simulii]|uniref:SYO1-like TPR repeats domain-containing protein n=1 Tax=Smittium simulii TaxID=133385 RepID=A0A2T9Y5S8_9FUNG|nr:hypothetical protein BB561_006213 [Smittium simulii]
MTSNKLSSKKIRFSANSSLGVPVNSRLLALLNSSAAPTESAQLSNSALTETIPPILKKLETQDLNERVWAIASVGQLLSSTPSTIKLLLKYDAINLLLKAFLDNSPEAVQEATGIIGNLINHQAFTVSNTDFAKKDSMFSFASIFDSLYANIAYILNKFEPLLKQTVEQNAQADKNNVSQLNLTEQKYIFTIYENIFFIIQSICEQSKLGIGYTNNLNLLPTIKFILSNISYLPISLIMATAQSFYTISEFNPSLETALLKDPALEMVNALLLILGNENLTWYDSVSRKITTPDQKTTKNILFTRILTGATLSNLQKSRFFITDPNSNSRKWDDILVNHILLDSIASFINIDLTELAQSAISIHNQLSLTRKPSPESNTLNQNSTHNGDQSQSPDKDFNGLVSLHYSNLEVIMRDSAKIQLSLELAANIFAQEDFIFSDLGPVSSSSKTQPLKNKSGSVGNDEVLTSEDEWMDQNSDDDDDLVMDDGIIDNTGSNSKEDDDFSDNDIESPDIEDQDTIEDDVEMLKTLGNESSFSVSLWNEAEPVIQVFLNKVVPTLLKLIVPPTILSDFIKTHTVQLETEEPQKIQELTDLEMLGAVNSAILVINTTAFACFNNFLTAIEQQLVSLAKQKSSLEGKDSALVDKLAPWAYEILQSISTCYTQLHSINNTDFTRVFANEEIKARAKQFQQTILLDWSDVLERGISCLWTIARATPEKVPLDGGNTISGLFLVCNLPNIPISLRTATVGLLGQISQMKPGHIENNQKIGTFMINLVLTSLESLLAQPNTNPNTLLPAIQALDDMFDTYSDNSFDYDAPVFVALDFLSSLKKILLTLKTMTKSIDKRKYKRMRSQADLVVTNLSAFIKYKQTERK